MTILFRINLFFLFLLSIMVIVISATGGTAALAEQDSGTPKHLEQKETKVTKPNTQDMQDITMAMAPAFGTMAEKKLDAYTMAI